MRAGGSRIASVLARTSAYPRTETHLAQQRLSGAGLSIGAVLLAALLLVSELRDFLSTENATKLGVDTQRGKTELQVLFDITFPALPCCVVQLDALDLAGAHEWDAGTGITRSRLDARGKDVGPFVMAAGQPDFAAFFGAANAQLLRMTGLLQLVGPEALREMQDAFTAGEGCRIHGGLPVPRVAGDFQLSINAQSLYMLRQVNAHADLNVSHTIHKLSFGPEFPGEENPLDDFVRTMRKGEPTGTFKYFLKLVPVQYRRLNGKVFDSHQYSVTEYFTSSKVNEQVMPAAIFSYDFSPVMLTIEERRRPLFHFLTRICAVVGGVFAICGLFARLL